MRRPAAIFVIGLLTGGCFTYAPVEYSSLQPDMTVRVQLPNRVQNTQVEGRVFEIDADHLSLLPEVRPGESNEPQSLPRPEITTVEVRTFNTARSMLVIGGTIAAGIAVITVADGGGGTPGPGDGGVLFEGIPLLRFVLGR